MERLLHCRINLLLSLAQCPCITGPSIMHLMSSECMRAHKIINDVLHHQVISPLHLPQSSATIVLTPFGNLMHAVQMRGLYTTPQLTPSTLTPPHLRHMPHTLLMFKKCVTTGPAMEATMTFSHISNNPLVSATTQSTQSSIPATVMLRVPAWAKPVVCNQTAGARKVGASTLYCCSSS